MEELKTLRERMAWAMWTNANPASASGWTDSEKQQALDALEAALAVQHEVKGRGTAASEDHMAFDWATWPWHRCPARTERWERCDRRRGHAGNHALEHGLDIPQWSTRWAVSEHVADCGRQHPGACAWVGRKVDGGVCLQPEVTGVRGVGSGDVEAIAGVLAEHQAEFQCDGDYGERQWVECSCGSDYFVGTDAGYAEHRAHVAEVLAVLLDRVRA